MVGEGYLGVPTGGDMLRLNCWVPLLDCIKSTLSGWKSKNLSCGYLLHNLFLIFFFFGRRRRGEFAWISWDSICLGKEVGSLVVRGLREINLALLGK